MAESAGEPPEWLLANVDCWPSLEAFRSGARLRWLYYLRAKRGVHGWLLWVYFTGDHFESRPAKQRIFPTDEQAWRSTLDEMKRALSLREPHPLSAWTRDAFVPV